MKLIELIPRTLDGILTEAHTLLAEFSFLDGVNIPDVLRLPHRSHDVAIHLAQHGIYAVPHIRCIDRSIPDTVQLVHKLAAAGITQVLIVSGDTPKGGIGYPISPVDVIAAIKQALPTMKVFAGTDPYRHSLTSEVAYAHQKLAAGADGFFSQPFFDVDFATYFQKLIGPTEFFVGISPVMTEANKHYWESINKVVFPPKFQLTLDQNVTTARQLMALTEQLRQHVYLMPIKMDPHHYLNSVTTG
jgi:methylenetetrahydrofolate reductase (NADPH)